MREKIVYEWDISPDAEKKFFARMPPRMYKYRSWKDENNKNMLINREIFLTSPGKFNDPFDGGLPYRPDPMDSDVENIKAKLEQLAPRQFPQFAHDKARLDEESAKQLFYIMQGPEEYFQDNYGYRPADLDQMFGVVSLTPHPLNILLWSHYGDKHQGFSLGFNTEKLVKFISGKFKKVNYEQEIPIISMLDGDQGLMDKLIYTKAMVWKYEDEYRITCINRANQKIYYPPEILETIHFGYQMPTEVRFEIIEIVKKHFNHVNLFDIQLNQQEFKLDEFQIY